MEEAPSHPMKEAPWLTEILQTIFGDVEEIREKHPMSWLLCPESPLAIDGEYTDTYLALQGLGIPVAVMPIRRIMNPSRFGHCANSGFFCP